MSSNPIPTDDEQGGEQSRLDRIRGDADWTALSKLGGAAVLGLAVNAVAAATLFSTDPRGIADGVAFLALPTILAVGLFHLYDPVDMRFLSPALMFVTIAGANTVALFVRAVRMGVGVSTLMSVIPLAVVALMFSVGPFLGAWAARRWWV